MKHARDTAAAAGIQGGQGKTAQEVLQSARIGALCIGGAALLLAVLAILACLT